MCSSSDPPGPGPAATSAPSPPPSPQGTAAALAIIDPGWPPDIGLPGTHVEYHGAPCPYPPTVLDFLPLRGADRGVVEDYWPCEVRVFWVQDMQPFVQFVRFLYANVTVFLIITGLLLNCFALRVLNSRAMRGTSLAVYLQALSVSDMGALVFTYWLGFLRSHYPALNSLFLNNDFLCRVHKVMVSMFPMTSQGLQTALTLERLLVVWRPMRAPNPSFPQESVRVARRVVATVYVSLVLVALSKWYFSGFEQYSAFEYPRCDLTTHSSVVMVYVYVALSTYLPGTLIFISNVLLVLKLRRTDALRRSLFAGSVPDGATYHTDAAARTLLLFSLLYLVLQLPLGVVETVELYWDVTLYRPPPQTRDHKAREAYIFWLCEKLKLKWARTLLFWLFQLSFVLNFVVYLKSASRFRAVAKALMLRWTRSSLSLTMNATRSLSSSWRRWSGVKASSEDLEAQGGGTPLPLSIIAASSSTNVVVATPPSSSSATPRSSDTGSDCSSRSSKPALRARARLRRSSSRGIGSCWRLLSKATRMHSSTFVTQSPPPARGASTSIAPASVHSCRRRKSRLHTWGYFLRCTGEFPVRPLSEQSQSSSSALSTYCTNTSTPGVDDSVFEVSSPTVASSASPAIEDPVAIAPTSGSTLSNYGNLDSSRQDLLWDDRLDGEASPGRGPVSVRQLLVRFRSERHMDRLQELQRRGGSGGGKPRVKFERFLSHPHRLP